MYIKYKDYIGKLVYYELSNENNVNIIIETLEIKPKKINFVCKESEITIPNILGNSHILYELQKEQDNQKAEGE